MVSGPKRNLLHFYGSRNFVGLRQGIRSNPISVQPFEFLRKYAETGVAQASGPPTADMSTLMYSDAGMSGMGIGLCAASVVATRVALSATLSNVYQSARYPGARSATAMSAAKLRKVSLPLRSSSG